MIKFIVPLLAFGLMGSAFAQSAPSDQPASAAQTTPVAPVAAQTATVPGAKNASASSLGELTPFYVVAGVAVAGAVAIAAGGGSSHHGTTGTH